MSTEVGVGLVVGLVAGILMYVWKSSIFTKTQKVLLTCSGVFLPALILLTLILYVYNKSNFPKIMLSSSDSKIKSQDNYRNIVVSIKEQKKSIEDLREKGIFSDSEYQEKLTLLDAKIAISNFQHTHEYRNLKKLYESEVLTKEQFDIKTDNLLADYKNYFSLYGANDIEFTWEFYQNTKANKRINPNDYKDTDFLGMWKFKHGQLFFHQNYGINKVKITWKNNMYRDGEWSFSDQLLNLKLYKSFGVDFEILRIDELGTHLFVYHLNNIKYICYKDTFENNNV